MLYLSYVHMLKNQKSWLVLSGVWQILVKADNGINFGQIGI